MSEEQVFHSPDYHFISNDGTRYIVMPHDDASRNAQLAIITPNGRSRTHEVLIVARGDSENDYIFSTPFGIIHGRLPGPGTGRDPVLVGPETSVPLKIVAKQQRELQAARSVSDTKFQHFEMGFKGEDGMFYAVLATKENQWEGPVVVAVGSPKAGYEHYEGTIERTSCGKWTVKTSLGTFVAHRGEDPMIMNPLRYFNIPSEFADVLKRSEPRTTEKNNGAIQVPSRGFAPM